MFAYLKGTLKLYPSLKSYYLSQNSEINLIKWFSNEKQKLCLKFLHEAPPKLKLDLWQQPSGLVIHLTDDALLDTIVLLIWFTSPQIVTQYKSSELSVAEISFLLSLLLLVFFCCCCCCCFWRWRKSLIQIAFMRWFSCKTLDNDYITEKQHDIFSDVCLQPWTKYLR